MSAIGEHTTIIRLPDKRCHCGWQMRPVWLFGRILRWTCDRCNPQKPMCWTLKSEAP